MPKLSDHIHYMVNVTISRYSIYRTPKPWSKISNTIIHDELQYWSEEISMRTIGTITIPDISRQLFLTENTYDLIELEKRICASYDLENNKFRKVSQHLLYYGFIMREYIDGYILSNNTSMVCLNCMDIFNGSDICNICNEEKKPFILINTCNADWKLMSRCLPIESRVDAVYGKIPYKQELIATAMHPSRIKNTLNTDDFKDIGFV